MKSERTGRQERQRSTLDPLLCSTLPVHYMHTLQRLAVPAWRERDLCQAGGTWGLREGATGTGDGKWPDFQDFPKIYAGLSAASGEDW
ncbi:hypothetical protein V495_06649 [Pseudogymnoascus sp. VKM F-4514 (FW-929)]|nr:hypothetical protein V495_06649 [Pseudogymnoascus sp. VKM F-4514 (FW-929)]KFY57677.1 hypothetical protein V497_05319 [Pseudogymnoascus sp. VKM F-4516 (FW-969)]